MDSGELAIFGRSVAKVTLSPKDEDDLDGVTALSQGEDYRKMTRALGFATLDLMTKGANPLAEAVEIRLTQKGEADGRRTAQSARLLTAGGPCGVSTI